mgnify:CR=1 FL=1
MMEIIVVVAFSFFGWLYGGHSAEVKKELQCTKFEKVELNDTVYRCTKAPE